MVFEIFLGSALTFVLIYDFLFSARLKRREIENSEFGNLYPQHGSPKLGVTIRFNDAEILELEITDFYGRSSESYMLKLSAQDTARLANELRGDNCAIIGEPGFLSPGRIEITNNVSNTALAFYSLGWSSAVTLSRAEASALADQLDAFLGAE